MKMILIMICAVVSTLDSSAQELYVFTEPASNMATGSLGFRLNNMLMTGGHGKTSFRTEPEIMWGVNKNLMVHVAAYASNMYQPNFKVEGGSLYAKYRFYSRDDIHSHFRMAGFGKLALINNPTTQKMVTHSIHTDAQGNPVLHDATTYMRSNDLALDGNHSGIQLGLVATKLQQKLAVSASASYINRFDNLGQHKFDAMDARNAINATASAGYLLLPKAYTDYHQTNMNVYLELLGSKPLDGDSYMLDAAPAVQFIFNSIARLDIGYRFKIAGQAARMNNSTYLLRFEYNWLNAIKKKS